MPLTVRKAPLVAAISLACTANISQAQVLEEVIVTAQKRAESLQDVPISISAVQGEKLQEAGIPNLAALADYVPNLHIASASVNTNIYLRGVGSGNNQGFEQSVGLYVDGIYQGRGRQYRSGFLDVERVEVLRGPQGTLFGKNTVAGAVNITTASPVPGDELNGQVAASYESHNGQLYEGFVSGSLTDTLAARLAFKYRETDGYVRNSFLGDDEGQIEEDSVRLTLVWQPTDDLSVNFKYSHTNFDRIGAPSATTLYLDPESRDELVPNRSAFANIAYQITDTIYPELVEQSQRDFVTFKDNGFGTSEADGIGIGENRDSNDEEYDNVSLNVEYDLNSLTLTSVTGWSEYNYVDGVDIDWLPIQFIHRDDDQDYEQFSQEFRITSPGGEFFDYVAGAYYESSEVKFDRRVTIDTNMDGLVQQVIGVPSLLTLLTAGAYSANQIARDHHYDLDTTSWAVFGQGTFNFTDSLRLTIGLRYTEEDKDVESRQFLSDDINGIGVPNDNFFLANIQATSFNTYAYDYRDDRTTDEWIPSINVQWDVTEDHLLYASFSQGFKSGGFTAADDGQPGGLVASEFPCGPNPDGSVTLTDCYDPTQPNADFEFDDESVDAFEIGGKHTLLGGGMTLNWAAFYTEYEDLQTAIFRGLGFTTTNAGESEIKGIEADLSWQATEDLFIGFNAAYLDAEYSDFADAPCTAIQLDANRSCGSGLEGAPDNDLTGESTLYASDWSASLYFNYNTQVTNEIEFFAGGDVNYRDEFSSAGDNDPIDMIDSYTKVNLRLGLRTEHWEAMLYGRNIFDEVAFAQSFDTPVLAGSHTSFYEEDRVWGARVQYSF